MTASCTNPDCTERGVDKTIPDTWPPEVVAAVTCGACGRLLEEER